MSAKGANKIRDLRTKEGLTQEYLAGEMSVTRQTIIAIEGGRYIPSLPLAMRLARYFNKSVEEVFDYE